MIFLDYEEGYDRNKRHHAGRLPFYSGKEYYNDTNIKPLMKLLSEALLHLVFFIMRDRMSGNVK